MSLKFKILNENSTSIPLDIGSFRFYSGEDRTLRAQIYTDYTDESRPIAAAGTISVDIPASPSDLVKTGVIDVDDRSIITIVFDETETASMTSGNLTGTITEGTDTRFVKSVAVLKKLSTT